VAKVTTNHTPQTLPFPMAKLHLHAVPNNSRQLPLIPPQNEEDIFASLQLSLTL